MPSVSRVIQRFRDTSGPTCTITAMDSKGEPNLEFLHSEDVLNRVKLDVFRRLSTIDLKASLAPGQKGTLKVRADSRRSNWARTVCHSRCRNAQRHVDTVGHMSYWNFVLWPAREERQEMCRLTFPCKRLTPLTAPLPRRALSARFSFRLASLRRDRSQSRASGASAIPA